MGPSRPWPKTSSIALPERDQERLPRLFIQLVSVGEESEDTRRRAAMTTLGEEARPLVAELATARFLVTSSERGHPRRWKSPTRP